MRRPRPNMGCRAIGWMDGWMDGVPKRTIIVLTLQRLNFCMIQMVPEN
jgi:hypothetical protein